MSGCAIIKSQSHRDIVSAWVRISSAGPTGKARSVCKPSPSLHQGNRSKRIFVIKRFPHNCRLMSARFMCECRLVCGGSSPRDRGDFSDFYITRNICSFLRAAVICEARFFCALLNFMEQLESRLHPLTLLFSFPATVAAHHMHTHSHSQSIMTSPGTGPPVSAV